MKITFDDLRELAPSGELELQKILVEPLNVLLPIWDIDTPNRVSHFLSQAAVEAAYFRTLEEYASGQAYEGRTDLGNIHPGDGVKYKGRGLFQTTGLDNYRRLQERTGIPFVKEPERLLQPADAVLSACLYWTDNKLAQYADADDGKRMSRAINRGNANSTKPANAELERLTMLAKAHEIWGKGNGSDEERDFNLNDASDLQRALNVLGYGPIEVDGDIGPNTKISIKAFQMKNGLEVDGVAGKETKARMKQLLEESD